MAVICSKTGHGLAAGPHLIRVRGRLLQYRARFCANPDGEEGTMIYNSTSSLMQYCDGLNWVRVGK